MKFLILMALLTTTISLAWSNEPTTEPGVTPTAAPTSTPNSDGSANKNDLSNLTEAALPFRCQSDDDCKLNVLNKKGPSLGWSSNRTTRLHCKSAHGEIKNIFRNLNVDIEKEMSDAPLSSGATCAIDKNCKSGLCRYDGTSAISGKCTSTTFYGFCGCAEEGESSDGSIACCKGLERQHDQGGNICMPKWPAWPLKKFEFSSGWNDMPLIQRADNIADEIIALDNTPTGGFGDRIEKIDSMLATCDIDENNPDHKRALEIFQENEIQIRILEYLFIDIRDADKIGSEGLKFMKNGKGKKIPTHEEKVPSLQQIAFFLQQERTKIATTFGTARTELLKDTKEILEADKDSIEGKNRALGIKMRENIALNNKVQGEYYESMGKLYNDTSRFLLRNGNNYKHQNWQKKISNCSGWGNEKRKNNWCHRYKIDAGNTWLATGGSRNDTTTESAYISASFGLGGLGDLIQEWTYIIDPIIPKGFCFRYKNCGGGRHSIPRGRGDLLDGKNRQDLYNHDMQVFKDKLVSAIHKYFTTDGDTGVIPFFHPEENKGGSNFSTDQLELFKKLNGLLSREVRDTVSYIWYMWGYKEPGFWGDPQHTVHYRKMILWKWFEALKENEYYMHTLGRLKSNNCGQEIIKVIQEEYKISGGGFVPGSTEYKEYIKQNDKNGDGKVDADEANKGNSNAAGSNIILGGVSTSTGNDLTHLNKQNKNLSGGGAIGGGNFKISAAAKRKAEQGLAAMKKDKYGARMLKARDAFNKLMTPSKKALAAVNTSARGSGGKKSSATSLGGGSKKIDPIIAKEIKKELIKGDVKAPAAAKKAATKFSIFGEEIERDRDEDDYSAEAMKEISQKEELEKYDVNHNEIGKNPSVSIFKILSVRYLKSWDKVFERKRKVKK